MLQKITIKENFKIVSKLQQNNQSKMSLVKINLVIKITNNQSAFTCAKSTIETSEQGVNYARSGQ